MNPSMLFEKANDQIPIAGRTRDEFFEQGFQHAEALRVMPEPYWMGLYSAVRQTLSTSWLPIGDPIPGRWARNWIGVPRLWSGRPNLA
jgi:hypothetical protein